MDPIDRYLLPDRRLDAREVAVVRQLRTLLAAPETRDEGLSFILQRIHTSAFRNLLLRVSPTLYTCFFTPPHDNLNAVLTSLFIVHSLSADPAYAALLLRHDPAVFQNLRALLALEDATVTAHTLEIVLNVAAHTPDQAVFAEMVGPMVTLFRRNVQYRPLAGRCLASFMAARVNQIAFVRLDGIDCALSVLSSHLPDEQLLAAELVLKLVKSADRALADKFRRIALLKDILPLLKPLLAASGTLLVRSWHIVAQLTLAPDFEPRFIQTGIFYNAVELIGEPPETTRETLPCALMVVVVVTYKPALLECCRGFSLANRLCSALSAPDLDTSLRVVLLRILLNTCADEPLRSELQSIGVRAALAAPLKNGTAESLRVACLRALPEPPASAPAAPLDTGEVQQIAEYNMKKAQARQIVEEIVSTEVTYCRMLRRLSQEIVPAFAEVAREQDVSDIFLNVDDVLVAQTDFLARLEARVAEQEAADWIEVADVFDAYFSDSLLETYRIYLNNADHANEVFSELRRKSRDVRRVVAELGARKVFVPPYLILPVQRLPRYLLLLQSLVKNTPAELPEHARLAAVCAKVNGGIARLNEDKRRFENEQALRRWTADAELPENKARRFLAEFAQVGIRLKKEATLCSVGVLSDVTVVLKNKRGRSRVVSVVRNCVLKVFETPGSEGNITLIFPSEKGTDGKLIFFCSNECELDALYEVLKEASDVAKKRRITLSSGEALVAESK